MKTKKDIKEMVTVLSDYIKDRKEDFRDKFNTSAIKQDVSNLFDNEHQVKVAKSVLVVDDLGGDESNISDIDIEISIFDEYAEKSLRGFAPRVVEEEFNEEEKLLIIATVSRVSGDVYIKSGAKLTYTNPDKTKYSDYKREYENSADICVAGFNIYYSTKDVLTERAYLLFESMRNLKPNEILEDSTLQKEIKAKIEEIFPARSRYFVANFSQITFEKDGEEDGYGAKIKFMFLEYLDSPINPDSITAVDYSDGNRGELTSKHEIAKALTDDDELRALVNNSNRELFKPLNIVIPQIIVRNNKIEIEFEGKTALYREDGTCYAGIQHHLIPALSLNTKGSITSDLNLEDSDAKKLENELDKLMDSYKSGEKTVDECIEIIDDILKHESDEEKTRILENKKKAFILISEVEDMF